MKVSVFIFTALAGSQNIYANYSLLNYELEIGFEGTAYRTLDSLPGKSYSYSYCPKISFGINEIFTFSIGPDWLRYNRAKRYFYADDVGPRGIDTVIVGNASEPGGRLELGVNLPLKFSPAHDIFVTVSPQAIFGMGTGWDFKRERCQDCYRSTPYITDGFSGKIGMKIKVGKMSTSISKIKTLRIGKGFTFAIDYENAGGTLFKSFNGMAADPHPINDYGIAISIGCFIGGGVSD